jgi:hypothetical protein
MSSGLPLKADIAQYSRHVSKGAQLGNRQVSFSQRVSGAPKLARRPPTVRPLNVSEDGSAAHDEYDHGRHHVKLSYYPMALKEGGRHAVRRDREPDHGNRHADHANSICDIHGSSPAIAASKCSRSHTRISNTTAIHCHRGDDPVYMQLAPTLFSREQP